MNYQLFHVIDDATVILRSKGVYRQVPAYRRGNQVYAKWGAGFVGLCQGHGTTSPAVNWDTIIGVDYGFENNRAVLPHA